MESLQIDWKNVDITFERDEFYESIQAPRWIDFTAPLQPVDDHEWFCGKTGCTHTTKTLPQTEDSILSDSQANSSFQVAKKAAPVGDSTASGVGKRAKGLVSSSYSSLSGIKEAFAKHEVLHLAKMPWDIAESNVHAVKKPAHASENQNPNKTCKAEFEVSKIPIFKAAEGFSKKIKMIKSKYVPGKQPTQEVLLGVSESTCSMFSEQLHRSQTPAVTDVSKSTALLGKKVVPQKKSTVSRPALKQQDRKVLRDVCGASEPGNKKVEHTRTPFSVYASRSAMTSSVAVSSKQTTMSARSLHNFQLGNEKSMSCRPPRIVARKAHQAGVIDVQTTLTVDGCKTTGEDMLPCGSIHVKEGRVLQAKRTTPMLIDKQKLETNGTLAYRQIHTSNDNDDCASTQPMVHKPCSTIIGKPLTPLDCDGEQHSSHFGKENERKRKAEEEEASMQKTLEKRLENLYLSTPSSKLAPRTHKLGRAKTKMGQLDTSNKASKQEIGRPQHVDSVADPDIGSSQYDDNAVACQMGALHHMEMHKDSVSHHVDVGRSLPCPRQSSLGYEETQPLNSENEKTQPLNSENESYAYPSAAQMSESFVDCMYTDKELPAPLISNMDAEKNSKKLQPVKDWQRKRGMKRKSSELNFRVNCSSKDHKHGNDKMPASGDAVSSSMCHQAKQASALARQSIKASQTSDVIDSCTEQHKKMKTAYKVQPFKPFRFRTEERGALRELGLARKEQVAPNPQELVHHALRMPSFGHPFRPQRSKKKLTVPKEPSFHTSKMRITCTGPPTLLGS